ncbi:MAG TPA: hypothetical protein VG871_15610, partial [Vicinamibacterales bacterium]|nr:hypothetical protein [Vicinamibacterales bacterium]
MQHDIARYTQEHAEYLGAALSESRTSEVALGEGFGDASKGRLTRHVVTGPVGKIRWQIALRRGDRAEDRVRLRHIDEVRRAAKRAVFRAASAHARARVQHVGGVAREKRRDDRCRNAKRIAVRVDRRLGTDGFVVEHGRRQSRRARAR